MLKWEYKTTYGVVDGTHKWQLTTVTPILNVVPGKR